MTMSELPPPTARQEEGPCSNPGCLSQPAIPCEYVDRRGRVCPTAWCTPHQHIVGTAIYCRRHAGVMVALLSAPEDERDFPDLDNRAPSLVEFMAGRLHAGIVWILEATAAAYPGASIGTDGLHITRSGMPRVRGWQHQWRLFDPTGPLATLALRVDEETDDLVQARVDGSVVHKAVPPWISQRAAPSEEEDVARREAFDDELLSAMWQAISVRSGKHY